MSKLFEAVQLKNLSLKNRVIMAPMCMYKSDDKGFVKPFHTVHYGSRAMGGTALIIQEATAVTPNGRISNNDLGIWSDDQLEGLTQIVDSIHDNGGLAGIQLAHAGRKYETEGLPTVAPSSINFSEHYQTPEALTVEEIAEIVQAFQDAARRSLIAGYDTIEIHAAHGYLIHQFLSPLSNLREDQYGGSFENRLRFLDEIIDAIRLVWPSERALLIRLSATDYLEGGITLDDCIRIVEACRDRVDLFHMSSGGLLTATIDVYPGYQVHFAEAVKRQCKLPTIAVGLIETTQQAESILKREEADFIGLGRLLLRDPYWTLRHAAQENREWIPEPYRRGFRS